MSSERLKYEEVWSHAEYRKWSHSLNLWTDHPEIFPKYESALDIGCGRLVNKLMAAPVYAVVGTLDAPDFPVRFYPENRDLGTQRSSRHNDTAILVGVGPGAEI